MTSSHPHPADDEAGPRSSVVVHVSGGDRGPRSTLAGVVTPRQAVGVSRLLRPAPALIAVRVVWALLAVTGAVAMSGAVPTGSLVAWWLLAVVCLACTVVLGPVALSLVRLITPLTVALMAVVVTRLDAAAWARVAAPLLAVVASVLVALGESGEAFVQAAAYGDERRLPLRPPTALLWIVATVWLLWAAATVAAVITLTNGAVALGTGSVAAVLALGWLLFVRVVPLARRWLVIVPAGLVVHDPIVLGETLMVPRPDVTRVRLAPADSEAADLTGPTAGYAIEVTVREPALVHRAPGRGGGSTALHATAFLVAPTRPGRSLAALAERRLPVG